MSVVEASVDDDREPELTPEQEEFNVASYELLHLGAYGHFRHWPEGVAHPRDYLRRLHAAQDRFAAAVRNRTLTEAAEMLQHATVGAHQLEGVDAAADLLLAARTLKGV